MAKVQIDTPSSRFFYPWPLVLVTSIDNKGKPNIMTVGASSICSSNPPTVGVAIGTMQYTLELIRQTGDFGVNIPRRDQLRQADMCGTISGREVNKFELAGFTVQEPKLIRSPLIAECPVSMECRVVHTVRLGNHDWVIGEIVAVHCDESVLDSAGRLDTSKCDPIFCFWNEYWSIGEKLNEWHFTRREL
ncbi:MAG: flavin reductase family protein [Armatimonadetes bacterium]|nr:flavin reductase family protein [Armatimonadota bacterium]